MRQKVKDGQMTANEQRRIAISAANVGLDGQNRITISKELLEFAGITAGDDVIVYGNIDRLEIWNKANAPA